MMKIALALVVALAATPTFAEEGGVPDEMLKSLGLGDIQVISDAEGMQVRGQSSSAESGGLLLVFGALFDPNTGGNDIGTFSLFSRATAENAGLNETSEAQTNHNDGLDPAGPAGLAGELMTELNGNPSFNGSFLIGGLGFSFAFGQ